MKIALAQINSTVGAIARNAELVISTLERAAVANAHLAVFPEMTLTGYPPLDLLDRPSFITHNLEALERVAAATKRLPAALVGFVHRDETSREGKGLYNAAALCAKGRVRSIHCKTLLPTYDVFDERRYFDPSPVDNNGVVKNDGIVEFGGLRLGISICEDIWNDAHYWKRVGKPRPYNNDPVERLAGQSPHLLINISASPFIEGKRAAKHDMFASTARRHNLPLLHVNLVGGNDSLIFDGASNVFNRHGRVILQARDFAESLTVLDTDTLRADTPPGPFEEIHDEDISAICEALTLGLRDYTRKTGFSEAVIGLSGGIDSAVTAALAARALGPDKVLGVAMPSRYSSKHSRDDARVLAENLGIHFLEIPIAPIYNAYLETLEPHFEGRPFDVAEENLQARARGNILMALANKFNRLVLSTGNKSEMAVGYCTLYGDMSGGLAVLSDVPKTIVYELALQLNRDGESIPWNTIEKPPSAELRPDQLDSDSLPPYDILDPIMRAYVEEGLYIEEIADRGFERPTVERIIQMIERNQYKRLQAPIGLKITRRAFGYGRRIPVARGRDQ